MENSICFREPDRIKWKPNRWPGVLCVLLSIPFQNRTIAGALSVGRIIEDSVGIIVPCHGISELDILGVELPLPSKLPWRI